MTFKRILSVAVTASLSVPALLAQNAKVTVEETSDENGRVIITRKEFKEPVKAYRFQPNWAVGIEAGANYYLGDDDNLASFGERTAPAFNLFVIRNFSPVFGIGVTLGVNQMKGAVPLLMDADLGHFATDKRVSSGRDALLQSAWCLNPHIDAVLNLDNLFAGYNPFRVYHASLLLGGGVLMGFDKVFGDPVTYFEPTFNMGLVNSFRLTDRLNALVSLRGLITGDNFDGEVQRKKVDGAISLTAGLRFTFGPLPQCKFRDIEDVTVERYNDKGNGAGIAELKELERKVEALSAENDALEAAASSAVFSSIPITLRISLSDQGKTIGKAAQIDLMAAAQAIKSTPNTRYGIHGTAEGTRTVFHALTGGLGVSPAQLECRNDGADNGLVLISTLVK
ncbi:MAG: hypothetical protein IJS62_00295 [Bacteroidales bacterium]|nr:hypothetical protein [Bacteroidales bacterium]